MGHIHKYVKNHYISTLVKLSQPSLKLSLVKLATIVLCDLEVSVLYEPKLLGFDDFSTLKVSRLASFTYGVVNQINLNKISNLTSITFERTCISQVESRSLEESSIVFKGSR